MPAPLHVHSSFMHMHILSHQDVEWFGRQDPFCNVSIGSQKFKTRTATDGGKTPVWNERFT